MAYEQADLRQPYIPAYHVSEKDGKWAIGKDEPAGEHEPAVETFKRKGQAKQRAKDLTQNNDYAATVIWQGGVFPEAQVQHIWFNQQWWQHFAGGLFVWSTPSPF